MRMKKKMKKLKRMDKDERIWERMRMREEDDNEED